MNTHILKRINIIVLASFLIFGLFSLLLPVQRASAEAPSGPTKRLIVRYSQVLGSSTEDPADSLSGYIQKEEAFSGTRYAVYTADQTGEDSLRSSGIAAEVFEDYAMEFLGDVPLPAMGSDAAGAFIDSGSATQYDGSGYAIVVIDSGVDKNHGNLSGKVVHEACFGVNDAGLSMTSLCPGGVEFSEADDSALDCTIAGCGHGTYVASAAAMAPSLAYDIDADTTPDLLGGTAAGASIISIQIASRSTSALLCGIEPECAVPMMSSVYSALDYVSTLDVGMPIAAVNTSIGAPSQAAVTQSECEAFSGHDLVKDAIDTLKNQNNIAPVFSNGNEGDGPGYEDTVLFPACISSAIAIGATNVLGDTIASYSNNGPLTTLLTTGGDSDGVNPDTVLWLPDNGNTGVVSSTQGTSFAAPFAAGAYADIREKHPDASVNQITQLLQDTGTDVTDGRAGYSVGAKKQIDIAAALTASTYPVISAFTGPAGTVNEGSDTDLTITTTDVASCSLDNGIGNVDVSGGTITVPGFETYNITCTGDFNDEVTDSLTVGTFNSRPSQPNAGSPLSVVMDVESRSSTISWEASTDSDGIDFYEVYLDGEMVDTTEELSYTFTDLGLDLEYTAEVYAVDTLGARSLATSEAFVLASTTEATPEAPDTGLLNLFENLTTTLATSAAGILSTGAILVFGRKFF